MERSSTERTTTTSRIPSLHSSSSYLLFQQFQIRRDLANRNPKEDFEVELGQLLAPLPEEMRQRVKEHPELHQLIEVVMDLGRKPLARFPFGDFVLSENLITVQDLEQATSQVGDFAIDNRAGISRTLNPQFQIRRNSSLFDEVFASLS